VKCLLRVKTSVIVVSFTTSNFAFDCIAMLMLGIGFLLAGLLKMLLMNFCEYFESGLTWTVAVRFWDDRGLISLS